MSGKPEGQEIRGALRSEEEALLSFLPTVLNCEREYAIAEFRNHPGAKIEHSRVALLDGRIVSHIRVYPRRIRMARCEIMTGNIGGVCTDPAFRGKGYGAALLRDALGYMRKRGIGMSIIHSGVTGFYASEGWETLPQRVYTFRNPPLTRISGLAVRRFERHRDLPGVARIHSLYNEDRSFSILRDRDYWQRHFAWIREPEEGFFVVESARNIEGYMRCNGNAINEVAFNPKKPEALDALFEAVARNGLRRNQEEFSICCPGDLPFLNALRDRGSLRETTRWHMLCRMTGLDVLLKAVLPGLRAPGGLPSLEIRANGESAVLDFFSGKARVARSAKPARSVELTQRDLFLWLSGEEPIGLSPQCRENWLLLREIVPAGSPYFWMIDHV